ncbi:MAG: 16S rRNA (guanine(966)-N(2))-methyltransferase RsmD [Leptotrichiaceae bacterium]|nr:16S rRNA (guanine(966)-N(2))-methyltransferase RsmD [Leptotrichiaceae bacterium]MBP6281218.1 16S rRNA (guanine(966)-N(2))-methyltransferase RsmD [Leptotrichiaceae bacterium]MBP7100180.1 16S rRNA (guanine(966)-N(2))-methyltransferase RsmD [Leptotrichiaceae bacterium]MBP7725615.1 16S rRNA (guanine(966)-N(2))-methyltransferase RsmD [Leptotrichiaceae bacterium]MBP9630002.1 16S rRNA (guanine(966)-N(2))-methyltransferase RsmD [Leptotrichiaceae bacterium]
MRIISGKLKNRQIKSREGKETRPTLERIKESIFSIIGTEIIDSKFLDLYAGTGNIAIEALSRGARRAVLIEHDKEALRIIIDNLNNLNLDSMARAYKNDVLRAIEILGRKNEKFNIIFMDPPYKENVTTETIKGISKAELLEKDGIIISEHSVYEKLDDKIGNFVKYDERNYNKKIISFYKFEDEI